MASSLFVNDTVGDIQAAKYGGPDKDRIPRFKRAGAGKVLGLDEGLRIVSGHSSREVQIEPGGKKRGRYIDADSQGTLHSRSRKRIKAKSDTSSLASGRSFVPIQRERKLPDHDTYIGHEFAGTNKSLLPIASNDEDELSSSDANMSETDDVAPQDELNRRLKVLNDNIRDNVQDVASWLSLVQIQEEVLELALREDKSNVNGSDINIKTSKARSNFRRSLGEVRFAVFEKATRAHPANALSLPLMTAKLELAASTGLWDSRRIKQEWLKGISSCSGDWKASVEMWNGYVDWCIGDGDSFVLEEVLPIFADALAAFRSHYYALDGVDSQSEIERASLQLLQVLVQVMIQAGYVERANGLLQALCELIFRRPAALSIETESDFLRATENLEDHWDLEDHRIGETGSKGWSLFRDASKERSKALENGKEKESNVMTFGSVPQAFSSPDPIVRWLALDKARAALRILPLKMGEEPDWATGEQDVDPFSEVLYSDIRPFLVPVQTQQGKNTLVNMFLSSIGVPASMAQGTSGRDHSHLACTEAMWPLHLLRPLQDSKRWESIDGEIMERTRASALSDPFRMPIKTWPLQLDMLFPIMKDTVRGTAWFTLWDSNEIKQEGAKIARVLLEQIGKTSTSIALTRLGLSELCQTHKASVKLAKQILGQDRNNIALWRAFARLERNVGSLDSARMVYKSLLAVDDAHTSNDLICVWADWAELEWESGERLFTLRLLSLATVSEFRHTNQASIATISQQSLTTMETLRARRVFEKHLSQPSQHLSNIVFCAALFQYLSHDAEEAFEIAMQVFDKAFTAESTVHEEIAMAHCKFLWRHIKGSSSISRSSPYVPEDITTLLSRYVLQFPHNSAFLALLAAFEMRTKVENVVRKVLEEKMQRLKDQATVEDWLSYIYCELHMNMHSVNENVVRGLFERAVEAKRTAKSSLLWQLYVRFEVLICQRKADLSESSLQSSRQDKETRQVQARSAKADERQSKLALSRAKSVLYRAIRQVPYCKAIYLAAFAPPLRNAFTIDELLQLSQVMQEKDLRFFADLAAFVSPVEEPTDEESSESQEDM